MSARLRTLPRNALLVLVMSALGLIFAMPLLFMVASSFKTDAAIFTNMASLSSYIPSADWSLANYRGIFQHSELPSFLLNSAIISATVVVGGVLVNSMLAFALCRLRWRGRGAVLSLVVALMVVPFEVIAIPWLSLVARLPWLDRRIGMDRLTGWHRWTGFTLLWTLLAHVVLIAFGAQNGTVAGQVFALFVIAIAAAEVGVGLAIVLLIYRNRVDVNLDEIDLMKG